MSAVMSTVEHLRATLAANRFMPVPPPELIHCGDGDFRAIGLEFLNHLTGRAGLAPEARMLDLGCGVGRIALPLTQYLSAAGTYDGADVMQSSIRWCADAITPIYPNFRFHALDLRHPLYNPDGAEAAEAATLPFQDGAFDFVCMVSLLTHLTPAELTRYAEEVSRVLAPGGRCFATAFLLNPPARAALRAAREAGAARLGFDPDEAGPVLFADPAAPLAAVAFDEDYLHERFLRFGLVRCAPAGYGAWSGRASDFFQDLCVFERA